PHPRAGGVAPRTPPRPPRSLGGRRCRPPARPGPLLWARRRVRLRFDRREDPRRGTHPARPPSGGDRRGPAQPTARPNLRAPRPRQHHRRRLSSPTMPPATPPLLLTPGHVSLDTLRRIVAEDRAVTL